MADIKANKIGATFTPNLTGLKSENKGRRSGKIDNSDLKLFNINTSNTGLIAKSVPIEVIQGTHVTPKDFTAIPSDVLPATDNKFNIGSTTLSWKGVYVYNYYDDAGNALSIFKTVSCPAGTNPVADTLTDTLSLTSSDGSVTITGDSATDTVNLQAAVANSFETINCPVGTDPMADSSTDILNLTSSDGSVTITGDSATDTINLSAVPAVVTADVNKLIWLGW